MRSDEMGELRRRCMCGGLIWLRASVPINSLLFMPHMCGELRAAFQPKRLYRYG